MQVNAFGSLVTPFFTSEPVRDFESALKADTVAVRQVLQRDAGAGRLSAAVAVRGVVPVGRSHGEGCREDGQGGPRGASPIARSVTGLADSILPNRRAAGRSFTRSTEPAGRVTSLPSVAAIVPPPPMSTPSSAPLAPPRMPPMIAPTPAPAPILPTSPLIPSLSIAWRHRGVDRIAPAANRDLIERDRQAAFAVGPRGLVHRADDAAQRRARGNQHVIPLIEVDHGRRDEAILDLRRVGAQLALEADVDLLARRGLRCAGPSCWAVLVLALGRAAVDAAGS